MQSRVEPAIIKLLENGEKLDKYSAAEKAFCNHRTAQRILKGARALGICHIIGWEKIYFQWIPVFSYGKGKDAQMPAPLTSKEIAKKRRLSKEVRLKESTKKKQNRVNKKGMKQIPSLAKMLGA